MNTAQPAVVFPPVGLLALIPLLAAAPTLLTALAMALLFLVSVALTCGSMAALGGSVASGLRILALFLVAGTWVSLLDLALQALAWPLWHSLDMYVPLVAANSLVLACGEDALRMGRPLAACRAGLSLGAQAACWLIPLGLVRELVGRGAVFSDAGFVPGLPGPFTAGAMEMPLLLGPAGAFLLLALAAASAAWIGTHLRRP